MAFVFFIESAGFSWLLEEEGGGFDRAGRVEIAECLGDCTCQCRMVLGRDLMRCTMQVFEAATCISRRSSMCTFLHNYYSLYALPPTLPKPSSGEPLTESKSAILGTPHHRCCSRRESRRHCCLTISTQRMVASTQWPDMMGELRGAYMPYGSAFLLVQPFSLSLSLFFFFSFFFSPASFPAFSAALSATCSAFFVFLVCRVRACSSSVSSGHQTTSFKPGMHLMPSAQLQSSRPSW
jgi:hypothetical protein